MKCRLKVVNDFMTVTFASISNTKKKKKTINLITLLIYRLKVVNKT